jgi:hypothetical protein
LRGQSQPVGTDTPVKIDAAAQREYALTRCNNDLAAAISYFKNAGNQPWIENGKLSVPIFVLETLGKLKAIDSWGERLEFF